MAYRTLKRDKKLHEMMADPRYWKCWRKRAFASEEAARKALTEHDDRPLSFSGLEVYECREKTKKMKGRHWHLGHSRERRTELCRK